MTVPYIGQIIPFAGKEVPQGWAFCNGQLLDTHQNTALFSIIGTTYGGDGLNTFALPNLQGRTVIHQNPLSYPWGMMGGSDTKQLTVNNIPAHAHTVTTVIKASAASGNTNNPVGAYPANTGARDPEYATSSDTEMAHDSVSEINVSTVGGGQPLSNMQPYLAVNFIIAIVGIYPIKE
jgi:microcystin-dependent protein